MRWRTKVCVSVSVCTKRSKLQMVNIKHTNLCGLEPYLAYPFCDFKSVLLCVISDSVTVVARDIAIRGGGGK